MPNTYTSYPPTRTDLTGYELINNPRLNRGTAFTESERDLFALHGLFPPHVGVLSDRVARRMKMLRTFETISKALSH